jgi:hypothetical protein
MALEGQDFRGGNANDSIELKFSARATTGKLRILYCIFAFVAAACAAYGAMRFSVAIGRELGMGRLAAEEDLAPVDRFDDVFCYTRTNG